MNPKVIVSILVAILVIVGSLAALTAWFWPLPPEEPMLPARLGIVFAATICFAMAVFVGLKGPEFAAKK